MNKLFKLAICTVFAVGFFSACSDATDGELYTQMVSLTAPRNSEGVHDIYLNYTKMSQDTFKLPVVISGSTWNDKDLTLHIGVDNDTLAIFNVEKFNTRTDLYYKQLPEENYHFLSNTLQMPKGQSLKSFPIEFNLEGINLVEKWILPVTIEPDNSYTINTYKGRGHAMLRINVYNDYSGTYAANGMSIYYAGEEADQPAVVDTRKCWVVDENTVFFYAGTTWEEDENRAKYAVKVKFNEGVTDSTNTTTGTISLSAADENNEIDFRPDGDCTYRITRVADVNQPYLMHYYVTLYMGYYYNDITSNPKSPIQYHATGSMTMERKINTLIPDRDQAIQW